ncbi:MAG TPA: hypothetical protein VD886_04220, partial [Herpetosiphonaceae bacterium]|nr:hypothetical protein [Herpetosiphonaceae bacterium]
MADEPAAIIEFDQSTVYQIRISGHLGAEWADWFGVAITPQANGDTLLTGVLLDQAALYGLIKKVRDVGLPLISVNRAAPDRAGAPKEGFMKAIVYTSYGPPDVLRIADIEKPVPNDDQMLVCVHAASINPAEW